MNEPGRDEWEPEEPQRDYEPIHPRGTDWRARLSKIFGPVVAAVLALAKFSFVLVKFGSIFIAVAAYALIWGWKFAVGVVVLILLHETGHYIEAKREGLHPKMAIAGPILGGAGAFVLYLIGKGQSDPRNVWLALAYFGFFLNLFNMLPFGFFDGGAVWRSARFLRVGGGGNLAVASYALYFATAAMLVLGMVASHVPQDRL